MRLRFIILGAAHRKLNWQTALKLSRKSLSTRLLLRRSKFDPTLATLALTPRNCPKRRLDCRGPFRTFSTLTSQSYRKRMDRLRQTLSSSAATFSLVSIVSLTFHFAARMNLLFTLLQTHRTRKKTTIQQSCRILPRIKRQAFLRRV